MEGEGFNYFNDETVTITELESEMSWDFEDYVSLASQSTVVRTIEFSEGMQSEQSDNLMDANKIRIYTCYAFSRRQIVDYIRTLPSFVVDEHTLVNSRIYWIGREAQNVHQMIQARVLSYEDGELNVIADDEEFLVSRANFEMPTFFSELDVFYMLKRNVESLIAHVILDPPRLNLINSWAFFRREWSRMNFESASTTNDPTEMVEDSEFSWIDLLDVWFMYNAERYLD